MSFANSRRQSLLEVTQNHKSHNVALLVASTQTAFSYLLEWTPNLISLVFLGQRYDDTTISALGFAILWANVFGYGLLTGLTTGLETMTSQAYGARNFKITSIQFWQCMWILLITMIPISILQYYSYDLLVLINGKEEICELAGYVTRGLIPSILINGLYGQTKGFLNGLNVYNLSLITQCTSASLHILWCYIFIYYFDLGLLGVILARTATETINLSMIWLLIAYTKVCKQALSCCTKESLRGWFEFLKVAIPIGLLLWLEWLSYEMYSFQASLLPVQMMAANIVMNNFSSFYFQFAYGVSIASTTFIGNSMGGGDFYSARKFSKSSVTITLIFVVISQGLLYSLRKAFAGVFTNDPQVQDEMLKVFVFFCVLMACDSMQAILTGIVRGIGHEKGACITFLFFYLIVGQSVAFYLTQFRDFGLEGILIGMIIGTILYDLIMIITVIFAKWEKLKY
ncbi:hypothetical protein pb186bvf_021074 [Paramecium bursaria]